MKRRVLVIVTVAAVLFIAAYGYWYLTSSRAHVPSGSAIFATVFVFDQPVTTITNSAALAALTQMLRSGRPLRSLHCCTAAGHIHTRFADGKMLSTAFGPGHDPSRYEFGMDGHVFTIPRSHFLAALQTGGVDIKKIPAH